MGRHSLLPLWKSWKRQGQMWWRFHSHYTALRLVENQPKTVGISGKAHSQSYVSWMRAVAEKKWTLPAELRLALSEVFLQEEAKQIKLNSLHLARQLENRRLPAHPEAVSKDAVELSEQVRNQLMDEGHVEQDGFKFTKEMNVRVLRRLRAKHGHWSPIEWKEKNLLRYLAGRFAYDYSCVCRVLDELRTLYGSFVPETFLDFCSGLGTGIWAFETVWPGQAVVKVQVDRSKQMQAAAMRLTQEKTVFRRGLFYRRQCPPEGLRYDVVLCAFSLLEFACPRQRAATLTRLLNHTGRFLVLIDIGNRNGFEAISQARQFVLDYARQRAVGLQIVTPCPHSHKCPLAGQDGHGQSCQFATKFSWSAGHEPVERPNEVASFSYVVFERLPHQDGSPRVKTCLPRVTPSTLRRQGHVHLSLCCPDGVHRRCVLTKQHHSNREWPLFKMAHKLSASGCSFPIDVVDLPSETDLSANEAVQTEIK